MKNEPTVTEFSLALLRHVRHPDNIYLKYVEFDPSVQSARCLFRYPVDARFPNSKLKEMTGGQINDVIACAGYIVAGLVIRFVKHSLNLDYHAFEKGVHNHLVNFVRVETAYKQPGQPRHDIEVTSTLDRIRRRGDAVFFTVEIEGVQEDKVIFHSDILGGWRL